MTVDDVKKSICTWINSLNKGVPAIVAPTSHQAPEGRYIAVRDIDVEQFGRPIKAKPGRVANENDTSFIYTVDLVITEVDGEGDTLREIRALMQLDSFRAVAQAQGFTLWRIGDIMNNDVLEGSFWIRQKAFTAKANFVDAVRHSALRAEAVGLELNAEEFEVTLNH